MTEPKIVNLAELARLLGTTQTTLTDKIARHADFPVVERGKNGVAYKFDFMACADWWDADQRKPVEEAEARTRQLDLWRQERYGSTTREEAQGLSLKEQLQFEELLARERQNKLAEGELVDVRVQEAMLKQMVLSVRGEILKVPSLYARTYDRPREERIALANMLREVLNKMGDTYEKAESFELDPVAA